MFPGFPSGIIVVPPDHLKEFLTAPDNYLNLREGLQDIDFRYVFRIDVHNTYHKRVIRNQLTQNIPNFLPDVVDELDAIFNDDPVMNSESMYTP